MAAGIASVSEPRKMKRLPASNASEYFERFCFFASHTFMNQASAQITIQCHDQKVRPVAHKMALHKNVFVPPLRGCLVPDPKNPRLTPWAKLFRALRELNQPRSGVTS